MYSFGNSIWGLFMDMERFDLANRLYEEECGTLSDYLTPEDISVTSDEPGFDSSMYTTSPEKAANSHCESIYIAGDNSIKKRWLRILPSVSGIRRAVLHTTAISNVLMEAVCAHGGIQRLDFGSTRLENLDLLSSLTRLTHLAVGSSPRISSLSPISSLERLVALGIQGNFPNIDNLNELRPLTELQGLSLCGQDYKVLRLKNLEPITKMVGLRFFSMFGVRIEEGGLQPLCELPSLEFLVLDPFHMHHWRYADLVAINEAHPHLKGNLIRRIVTEPEIAKKLKIKP